MPVVKLEKDKKLDNKSGLLIGNPVYKPFRYPWCYDA
jgi:ribonucleoside-diphosphate reductase beta chain